METENKSDVSKKHYVIGTRGSALAKWQARHVAAQLDIKTEIFIIKTSGDRFQNIALQGQSQTGFFTKEIEHQLLEGAIDIAVHSLKDLPTLPHPDLELAAYLPRAAVSDLLLVHPDWHDPKNLIPVKKGCKVGATSLRRQALVRLYSNLAVPEMLRGNVPTRIEKCKNKQYGAIVLAQAGVQRLAIDTQPLLVYQLNPEIWLPAPGQGVVVVQIRKTDKTLQRHLKKINNSAARTATTMERSLLAQFEGGCHTAFGALAVKNGSAWKIFIGLDQENKGWGQSVLQDKLPEDIQKVVPADIQDFSPVKIDNREALCQPIRL